METIEGKLGIEYNNLRIQLLLSYKDLCHQLNNSMTNGVITIESKKIQYNMEQIRLIIGMLAASYINGNENFKVVGSDICLPNLNIE
jgi:hypothetical protein